MSDNPLKVVTEKIRFSYVHIWEPTSMNEGDKEKYGASIIIDNGDKITLNKINAAIEAAKEQGKSTKFAGKIPANLKTPLRDGDDRPDDAAYENCYFVNANNTRQPNIVDASVAPILDRDEFYSGCYGRASLTFFPYNSNGNKGIACSLNHVQKTEEGERLSGDGSTAEDDFGTNDDLM